MNIAQVNIADVATLPPYGNGTLPAGIRSRHSRQQQRPDGACAGGRVRDTGRQLLLLLHGFPELAYSWRKVMLPLAAAGYHVIAPDQRGYGRTLGWDGSYDADRRSVPYPQHGARCHRARLCARLPVGGGRRRPRCRLAGRVLVRADPARRLPQAGADELAVPGAAEDRIQHRQRRRAAAAAVHRRRARRRAREAAAAAQILPQSSAHARRQRRHAARSAGPARLSSAPTTTTRAPTGKGTSRIR